MRKFHLRTNKADDGADGSASGYEAAPPEEAKPETPAAAEAPGNTDDFGYKDAAASDQPPKEGDGAKKEAEKAPEKPAEKEEQQDTVTGYGDEPPKVDPPKEEEKKPDEKPADDELGYELKAEGVAESEIEKIKTLAKTHKLPEATAKAILEMKKAEIDAEKASQVEYQNKLKQAVQAKKAEWHKELKDDPSFGGQNFSRSIHKVDKVLNQIMTETKKKLTESKTMLPPYVMRDIAKMHDQLFGTDNLVQGGEKGNSKVESSEDDHLDFYQNS